MSEIKKHLDSNIPQEAITKRTQSGVTLSYLESWYVIDRLNQVLGTENWSWEFDLIPLEESTAQSIGKRTFLCKGTIKAVIDQKLTTKSGIGFGSDKGNFNFGEMAAKEAETDALKRAAMKLGRSLGLALYDKSGEFIDDEVKPVETKTTPKSKTNTAGKTGVETGDVRAAVSNNNQGNTKILRQQIKSAFSVLEAQKKITKQQFVSEYLKGAKVDDLNDEQVNTTLNLIKTTFKELGL